MVINVYGCDIGGVFVRLMGVALVPEAVSEKLEPMVLYKCLMEPENGGHTHTYKVGTVTLVHMHAER